jgi:(1->4)-alpha-D-glucan 1-alpha-D-glucosylmutase
LCEVGGTPDVFSTSVPAFHEHQRERQATSPMAMLADTTHDTKRSSGVRSRSLALAANAEAWVAVADAWVDEHADRFGRLDPGIVSLALQTAVTARPLDADRLEAYLVKAAREGDRITSWTEPDAAVEELLVELASALVADSNDGRLAAFAQLIEAQGDAVGLRVLALQLTCPGFPDLYQGSPRRLLSLVDPDNRVQPDWEALDDLIRRNASADTASALAAGDADLARSVLTERVLRMRRRRPGAFGPAAGYLAVEAAGSGSDDVVAFARTIDDEAVVVTVVVRATDRPVDASAVELTMPPGTWRSITHDDARLVDGGSIRLSEVLEPAGFGVLERTDR